MKRLLIYIGTEIRARSDTRQRNTACAGGTGAFIDQMATLLKMSADEMNKAAEKAERTYTIASRCGVFAKTDVQPLLNQGAAKPDIAASIFQAVVNQTIAGLAQGRKISGKVLFLGGPLYYCKGLQQRFKETLGLSDDEAVFPEYARYAVALGTAIYAAECADKLNFAYWHHFAIYFASCHVVSYFCMHTVCKVYWCCSSW